MLTVKYGPALSELVGVRGNFELESALKDYFRFPNPKYNPETATQASASGDDYKEPEFISFIFEGDEFDNPKIPSGLYWALKVWGVNHKVEVVFDGFPSYFNEPDDVPEIDENVLDGVTLRDYQIAAIKSTLARKRGVMEIATGGGKSECCIAITKILGKRTLCITPDQAAMKNLWSRFNSRGVPAGRLGQGFRELDGKVVVAIINSLHQGLIRGDEEVTDWIENSEVLFSDEAHHQKAASWIAVASRSRAEYRVFMSGTPFKDNRVRENPSVLNDEDSWVVGLSGRTIYYLPPKQLIKMGALSPGVYVSFPTEGPPLHRVKFYPKVYESGIVENKPRNEKISRLLSNLAFLGRYPLVSIEKLEHGREIQRILWNTHKIPSVCSYGSGVLYVTKGAAVAEGVRFEEAPLFEVKTTYKNGKRTKEKVLVGRDPDFVQVDPDEVDVVRWLQDGVVKVLIGSRIFDEAQDIPFLTDLVNAAGGKASQRLRQKIGRILRRSDGKSAAWFWDPWDLCHFYLTNHSRKRLATAKEEGYPVVEDWMFARPFCEVDLKEIKIGSIKVKEQEIEVSVSMTLPLSGQSGSQFYVKPSVSIRGQLEPGDNADRCAEILHHKAVAMFMREVYRQAAIAGHIGSVGFEKARNDFVEQSKQFLAGIEGS